MSRRVATPSRPASIKALPTPAVHKLAPRFLTHAIRVLVVGCGGNGSHVVAGLVDLHNALLAWGHPAGLDVLVMDGDVVSPTNTVRQPFAVNDVGHFKAPILINRINAFWGLNWRAISRHIAPLPKRPRLQDSMLASDHSRQQLGADIVIGCVDSRSARRIIRDRAISCPRVDYWLDLGNDAATGQFVLGQPRRELPIGIDRLPTIAELFPESIDVAADAGDTMPTCSAQEALQRQEPFVNRAVVSHALAMLTRLFRYGEITHHGGFVNLESGRVVPIPVSVSHWNRMIHSGRIRPEKRARKAS